MEWLPGSNTIGSWRAQCNVCKCWSQQPIFCFFSSFLGTFLYFVALDHSLVAFLLLFSDFFSLINVCSEKIIFQSCRGVYFSPKRPVVGSMYG